MSHLQFVPSVNDKEKKHTTAARSLLNITTALRTNVHPWRHGHQTTLETNLRDLVNDNMLGGQTSVC